MTENEAQRLFQRQELLLVLHDETVHVIVRLGSTARVFEHALLILGKIAVVQLFHRERQHILVFLLSGQGLKRLFKDLREFPF